ncbi:MAG TPA: hypothetical protein VK985_08880 [Rariglobus sp.]|nr:hypothetical protein [Rariglobus sp.]
MKTSVIALFVGVGLLCATINLRAEVLTYRDAFDRKAGQDGKPLDLRPIGAGKLAWEASANVVLAEGKGVRVTDNGPFVSRVALPAQFKTVTIEADIKPAKTEQGWISIGMGGGTIDNPSFGGLFLLLRQSGLYSLMFNPDPDDPRSAKAFALKTGYIQTWNPDTLNSLKIVYDRDAGTISAYANSDELLVDSVSLKEKSLVLDAAYAGFSGVFQSSRQRGIGKFNVTISK